MEATLTLDTKRSLRFKADEFNNLRGFIILQQMNTAVEMIGMRILMECMDAVRDLEIGETIYCVPAKSTCYWGKDLAKVNERANYWERFYKERESCEDYRPNWSYSFAIKRTEKNWVYRYVDYKFI
ncbi:MAG: hypothetical protein J6Q39_07575 [Bacteroidales bacterium]|nr:hypothetical protein [Bacteroidales bacterium]